jgi:hypothetical protein
MLGVVRHRSACRGIVGSRTAGARAHGALLIASLLLLTNCLPAGAAASEPGVHGDPNGPTGKEYAFPLGQARGIGGRGGTFGQGITAAPGAAAAARGGARARRRVSAAGAVPGNGRSARAAISRAPPSSRRPASRERTHGGASGGAGPERATTRGSTAAARVVHVASGASAVVWMLGAAFCVVALGALGGQALTRRERRHDMSTSHS